MSSRLTAVCISLLLLVAACGQKQETDPLKLLQRKWVLHSDDTTAHAKQAFLLLGKQDKEGTSHFQLYLPGLATDTLTGNWELNEKLLRLTPFEGTFSLIPDNIPPRMQADSLGTHPMALPDTNLTRSETPLSNAFSELAFQLDSLSGSYLALTYQEQTYTFTYKAPHRPGESLSLTSLLHGAAGLLIIVALGWLMSNNRRAINWKLIGSGILLQIVLAISVLKVPFVETLFESVGAFFIRVISFTQEGTTFLFKSFGSGQIESPMVNFVVMVLPTVIFFSALTSLLFYWGILQRIVYGLAWVMKKTMRLSGAESMGVAGNIFLGQTEAPLLVKPYLGSMTKSELMCLMTGGMSTIAGGVLAAYVGFLGGDDPEQQLYFAKHLLTASVMAAPAAIVAAKLLVPETEEFNTEMKIPRERIGNNALEAITNGTGDGLRLAVNVAAMLLVFIALIAMGNWILKDIIGEVTGLNAWISANTAYDGFSLQFMVGYAFAPIAYLLGVPSGDTVLVGQLLGEKTILNEFYAYTSLGQMKADGVLVNEKSIIMATYILCGFANFSSIGIQIGGIGALAPGKKTMLAQLGFRALIGGTLACLFTSTIVGSLM